MKLFILILSLSVPFAALAQDKNKPPAASLTNRGKYIVDHVAMCIQCHTPRDTRGQLLSTEYLLGAPVPVNGPPFPDLKWAVKAPAIAGLSGYSTEQGIRLLMEGKTRDGRTPMPPMPPFRMNRADAEAVVAFLQSLK